MAGSKLRSSSHSATSPPYRFPTMATIDGDPKTGWAIACLPRPRAMLMLRFAKPVTTDKDSKIVVHIHQDSDDRKSHPPGASGLRLRLIRHLARNRRKERDQSSSCACRS